MGTTLNFPQSQKQNPCLAPRHIQALGNYQIIRIKKLGAQLLQKVVPPLELIMMGNASNSVRDICFSLFNLIHKHDSILTSVIADDLCHLHNGDCAACLSIQVRPISDNFSFFQSNRRFFIQYGLS